MRSLQHLLTAAGVAALLTGCASTDPSDTAHLENAYERAAAGSPAGAPAAPTTPAAPGVAPRQQGGPAGQPPRAVWPHQVSDLKPDPGVRFGQLANGMRYALMKNATPAGEASLRLRIDAGSLMERDDQLGLAHFMEHMIFNGSKNVPEGEFVKRLERVGLAFGPDTNAYTSFDETVYMLELPETNAEVIDTALLLMREAAGEATLAAEAIDRERGVVLSEERTRDTPGSRSTKSAYDFLFKDQLPPKRFPIGDVSVIRAAPRARFVEFYEAYYRPENATLVVVGDFEPEAMERKIRERFSDWRGQGPAGVGPNLGEVAPRGTEVRTFVEPGAPASLQIAWVNKPELEPDTRARRRKEWIEGLGLKVINRRYQRLARGDNPAFIAADVQREDSLDTINQTAIGAVFAPGGWRRALEAAEQESRRAVQYGVTQAELDREITEYRTGLQAAVAGQTTRRSSALASAITTQVNDEDVFTAPDENLAVFEEAVRGLKAEQVSAVLKGVFDGQGPLVFLSSPQPIADADKVVAAAFNASRQVAVAAPTSQTAKAWPYTSFGAPGAVAERRQVPDLGTTFVRFNNGVRLTVRPSTNRKDQVFVDVRVGDGELDLPRDRPSPLLTADVALTEGGLGRLTTEEIEQVLSAEVYGVNLEVEGDTFSLSGSTRPQDLDTQLQVLAAYLTDPAWRPQGLQRIKSAAPNAYEQFEATPGGVLGRELGRLLRSGDERAALPPLAAVLAERMEDIKRLIGRPLTEEPIELVIVGDVTVDEAIRQAAATFGALPRRREVPPPAGANRTTFPAGRAEPVRLTHKGRPDQAIAFMAWPTTDYPSDPQRARALDILEEILGLRLNDEIREKQGVTYSPSTGSTTSYVYPGYGYVSASIEAPPDKLQPFFTDVLKIAKSLRDEPVSADELQRAVKPRLEGIERSRAGNGYWLSALGGAQSDPRRLTRIRETLPGLRKVTPADVQRVAREYLIDEKAYRLVVTPEGRPAGTAGGR